MLKKAYTATLLIILVFSLIQCAGDNGNSRLDDIKRQERETGNYC